MLPGRWAVAIKLTSLCGLALPVLLGCAAAEPTARHAQASGELPQDTSFQHAVCPQQPCAIVDIANPELNYGQWLATAVGVQQLAALPVDSVAYVEVTRDGAEDQFDIGRVRYVAQDEEHAQTLAAQLSAIEDGGFSDGLVAMRLLTVAAGRRIDVWFSASFHPTVDEVFGGLRAPQR